MRTNNHHEGQCTHCPGHNCSNGEQLMNERRMLAHGQKESTREWEEEKVERKKTEKGREIHSNISEYIDRNQLDTL